MGGVEGEVESEVGPRAWWLYVCCFPERARKNQLTSEAFLKTIARPARHGTRRALYFFTCASRLSSKCGCIAGIWRRSFSSSFLIFRQLDGNTHVVAMTVVIVVIIYCQMD